MFVNSRFNFCVPFEEHEVGLFNTSSGAVLLLSGQNCVEIGNLLSGDKIELSSNLFDKELFQIFSENGFVVKDDTDEIEVINQRFLGARKGAPIVITITVTQDCNLGCYYCYEERGTEKLNSKSLPQILKLIEEKLIKSGKKAVHVDWYGGEPMLNVEFIEPASVEIQKLCQKYDCDYAASIISNGTRWVKDVGAFVEKHKISQAQISLDGLEENHNKRRRFRSGYRLEDEEASFWQAVKLIDKLLEHTRVDIRLNIDRKNVEDVDGLIELAKKRGWFEKPFQAKVQPAKLAAFSEHSSFMRNWELSGSEFDKIREHIKALVEGEVVVEEFEIPDGFPYPRDSVCAALGNDSVVVGAGEELYRCGLQVGEKNRVVGKLQTDVPSTSRSLPVLNNLGTTTEEESKWWEDFNPTELESCQKCSFLPICWGGCPKKHLEKDQYVLDELSLYWRTNLPQSIAKKLNKKVAAGFAFTEIDQFKKGFDSTSIQA